MGSIVRAESSGKVQVEPGAAAKDDATLDELPRLISMARDVKWLKKPGDMTGESERASTIRSNTVLADVRDYIAAVHCAAVPADGRVAPTPHEHHQRQVTVSGSREASLPH